MKKLKTTYHRARRKGSNPKAEKSKRNKTCDECPSTFLTSNGLAQHKKIHKKLEESDYKCSICGETFDNAEKFRKHMFMHDVKLYKCESCGASFKYLQSYMRHLRDYPQPHYFPCDKCNKVFKRLIFLNKHYCNSKDENVNEDINYIKDEVNNSDIGYSSCDDESVSQLQRKEIDFFQCKECDWIFTSEFMLKRHLEIYSDNHFFYPCCRKQFKKNSNIKNHACNAIKTNKAEEKRPYKCDKCSASFFRYPSLRQHMKKYPGKHDFQCDDCKKRFPDSLSLEKHLCIFKNQQDFKCSCLKSFENMQQFRNHVGNQRPYTCCACKIKCITFNNLINHIRTHTKEKPFPCSYCDKSFSVKQTLRLHLRNHLGEKPYKCSKCNYSSSTKWNLQLHEKRHDPNRKDDKTFLCNECGALFYMKHHLRRHILTHNQEKNHLCKICGKLFSQSSYLNKHLEIHKDKKGSKCEKCNLELSKNDFYGHHVDTGHFSFVCDPCKKVFVSKNNLQKHLKIHNKVVDQEFGNSDCDRAESWGKEDGFKVGQDNLICLYCDKIFLKQGILNHHIRNTHGVITSVK